MPSRPGPPRGRRAAPWPLLLPALLAALILSAPSARGQSLLDPILSGPQEEPPSPSDQGSGEGEPSAPAPEVPAAIPLPEVASAAERTAERLREMRSLAEPQSDIAQLAEEFEEVRERGTTGAARTRELLEGEPRLDALGELERSWTSMSQQLATWRHELTRRAIELEARLEMLRREKARWQATREEALASEAPADVMERIDATRAEVARVEERLERRRSEVLTLQNRVAQMEVLVADVMDAIRRESEVRRSQLFSRDVPVLWEAIAAEPVRALVPDVRQPIRGAISRAAGYLAGRGQPLAAQATLLVLLLASLVELRRRARRWEEDDPRRSVQVLWQRPLSTSLLLLLLSMALFHPNRPGAVRDLGGLLILIPLLRVLPSLLQPGLRPALYALAAFYLVDRARSLLAAAPLLERLLFLAETGAATLLLARLRAPSRLEELPRHVQLPWSLAVALRVGLVLMGVSLLANLAGFMNLARLLGQGALQSAYGAVLLYAGFRIVRGLAGVMLRSRRAAQLHMVRRHRALLEHRLAVLLGAGFVVGWLVATLDAFALSNTVLGAGRALLDASLSFGAVTISVGDLLAFALTLVAAVAITRALGFVLDEDVFPRLSLQRGVPTAISATVRYTLLLSGFLLAVSAAGVDLQRFTLLAGALGVGIGFGLQNVVNNFASGLILLYERPIQVGDAIELQELFGEVRRIGIRSSTVRTWDGAEVIVPNGDLISARVTNWTLSDRQRRLTVAVRVAYGSDPQQVLDILARVAHEHPEVLDTPAPFPRFVGFGESGLDFELWAFVARFENFFPTANEVILAVHDALREAGIEIPYPQRDLHLRSADAEAIRHLGEERGETPRLRAEPSELPGRRKEGA